MSAIAWLDILPQPGQGSPEDCRLPVLKASDTWLVVGIPRSGGNWSEREYFFKESKFIPHYPFERNLYLPHDKTAGWRITVIGRPDLSSRLDHHVFASRQAALNFQQFVTGYSVVGYCENVFWDCTIKTKVDVKNLTRFQLQDRKFKAEGEIQLWQPVDRHDPRSPSRVGTSYSEASPLTRTQTGESSRSGLTPAVSQRNGVIAHFNHNRPPLLVAFLRGTNDRTKYSMTKIRIERGGLPFRRDLFYQPNMMEFQNDKGFKLDRLDGVENSTNNRDVCAFARDSELALKSMTRETLTCLKISARDEQQLQAFRSRLDGIRQGYEKREMEQGMFKEALNRGKAPAAVGSPSDSRRTSSISFLPGVDRSEAFPPTPSVQELFGDPITATVRHELSPEYLTRLANYASTSPPIEPTETPCATRDIPRTPSPHHATGRPPTRPATRSNFSIRRSASAAARPEESGGRRAAAPSFISTPPSESSSSRTISTEKTDDVFADLDSGIRRFMSSTPGLGSPDDTIRTLHSLPGGPRALLYQFGSIPSSSDGEPGRQRRRFRCPFDLVYPQHGVNTGCQGPGFYPLERLWRHLERHHSSFDCLNCLRDFHDYAGIQAHMLQGCRDKSANLPRRIPFASIVQIERTLLPHGSNNAPGTGLGILEEEFQNQHALERQDIERWDCMWDVLFPSLGGDAARRPSPFLEAPSISQNGDLARLEMIFAAMVDNDTATSPMSGRVQDGNGMITKTKAKRYLRAAIQALVGEELDPWERVLASVELGVGVGSGSGSVSPRSVQVGWASGGSNRLRNGDGVGGLGIVGRDFLRLMGASRSEGE